MQRSLSNKNNETKKKLNFRTKSECILYYLVNLNSIYTPQYNQNFNKEIHEFLQKFEEQKKMLKKPIEFKKKQMRTLSGSKKN